METIKAINRVCEKRFQRGTSIESIIAYCDRLINTTWKNRDDIKRKIYSIRGFWYKKINNGEMEKTK